MRIEFFIEDDKEHGTRASKMKTGFARLSWPWIISVCFREEYTEQRCPMSVHDNWFLYKLVVSFVTGQFCYIVQ